MVLLRLVLAAALLGLLSLSCAQAGSPVCNAAPPVSLPDPWGPASLLGMTTAMADSTANGAVAGAAATCNNATSGSPDPVGAATGAVATAHGAFDGACMAIMGYHDCNVNNPTFWGSLDAWCAANHVPGCPTGI